MSLELKCSTGGDFGSCRDSRDPDLCANCDTTQQIRVSAEKLAESEKHCLALSEAVEALLTRVEHQPGCGWIGGLECTCWIQAFRAKVNDHGGALAAHDAQVRDEERAETMRYIVRRFHDVNTSDGDNAAYAVSLLLDDHLHPVTEQAEQEAQRD
jgi:hypothetical protein